MKPLYIVWDERLLGKVEEGSTPLKLGYRLWKRQPFSRLSHFLRPWALWAPLRSWEKVKGIWWATFDKVYHWGWNKGLFYFKVREFEPIRWRAFRIGCDPFIAKLRERERH